MVDKIIEKYEQLKGIIAEYYKAGKREEDQPTLIEAVKLVIKEFQEILDEPGKEE